MNKESFIVYYDKVVKVLANFFIENNSQFNFVDNPIAVYEEYLNQKNLIRRILNKSNNKTDFGEKELLDRHKVCACMTIAIIKVRLLTFEGALDNKTNKDYLIQATRANEQLAFYSAWELLKAFIKTRNIDDSKSQFKLVFPTTYHDKSFKDTITRSLFYANAMNNLSVPLLANIYFLLERYSEDCNVANQSMKDC